jgi:DNA-binding NarL/FixJ family response regulator
MEKQTEIKENNLVKLSRREREILNLILLGYDRTVIAMVSGLKYATITVHIHNIRRKLG